MEVMMCDGNLWCERDVCVEKKPILLDFPRLYSNELTDENGKFFLKDEWRIFNNWFQLQEACTEPGDEIDQSTMSVEVSIAYERICKEMANAFRNSPPGVSDCPMILSILRMIS